MEVTKEDELIFIAITIPMWLFLAVIGVSLYFPRIYEQIGWILELMLASMLFWFMPLILLWEEISKHKKLLSIIIIGVLLIIIYIVT